VIVSNFTQKPQEKGGGGGGEEATGRGYR